MILIVFVSVSNFYIALLMEQKESIRGHLLFLAVVIDMGILGFFKYYNFFIENLSTILKTSAVFLGAQNSTLFRDDIFLQIILPVGISFLRSKPFLT
ncbi:alginate O-acetyltransferase AlgI domain protein [Leptospira interrogans serovar Icterohaemorrhagiae str. Verdun HP]|uniref:Alginate O-acetyltransferase AlgI domain protein n=1 Tax=Leptospira interrogans serovar Icterohaemorrhagiae str. Verdun HP TaxID=1049910 RepID=M6RPD4_LEPIR|nr:alginate O-acetyltransferase AlgI domain protein [Leptospira interrogans serovar Icterohaemorrhagiae str. Verdun HP]